MPSACLNVLVGVWLLVALRLRTSKPQFVQLGLCEMHCHCPSGEAVVDCNRQDRLQGVPTNLPRGVTKLYIQEGSFPAPSILTRANMTGLENLEHMSIIYCNLQAIESKTFLGMTKLKHLDLSRNALKRLDTYTFFGLQLINLYLQEQHNLTASHGLQISDDAFDGLTADQINLRGNNLYFVRYSMFSKVNNLHRLILSDNRITHLDEGFSKHFNGQTYLLDLTANPLECVCNLAWIAALSEEWANSLPGLNMTCVYRHSSNGAKTLLELRRLSVDHLCPSSRIQHIEVSVTDAASRVILDCTAVAIPRTLHSSVVKPGRLATAALLSNTPPEVAWQYVESGHLREIRRLPSETQPTLNPSFATENQTFPSSTVRLNVTLSNEARQYKCTTRNTVQDPQEVVVTVRGPLPRSSAHGEDATEFRDTTVPTKSEFIFQGKSPISVPPKLKGSSMREDLLFTEPHYLLQPQFSLVQMALAVGGTFLSTLILLFIGARCLSAFRPHTIFRLSSSASSINATDAKVVYQPGTMSRAEIMKTEKTQSSSTQNGSDLAYKDNGQMSAQHPYPQLIFTGIDTRNAISPQFTHLSNLPNHYLRSSVHPSAQTSSSSGTDEIPSSLAHLVSTPLIRPSTSLHPMLHSDVTVSPCLTNLRPVHTQLAYWPATATATAPPGSPYSIAGSHEYDVPRVMDLPPWTNAVGTLNRSNLINASDVGCDFRSNKGVTLL
ncbi:hypothetical protein CRM22_004143 [Opisthorchis felineus]|uniref:Ig-like domain-containing protein n=1 Tax=Opisthorchis felineus TaxID=147828 RepID=A0A4S2LXQ9_OPIFE|nr:hypothetical protein CRM22_004143 [Opisthorchis felineus]